MKAAPQYCEHDKDVILDVLRAAVLLARDHYYNRTPVMSDVDFDALVRIWQGVRRA